MSALSSNHRSEIVAGNPTFAGEPLQIEKAHDESASPSWRKQALKAFAVLGVLGVSIGVGFVAGKYSNSSGSSTTVSSDSSDVSSATAEAYTVLNAAYLDPTNPAIANLTSANITTLLELYEEDPDSWDDQFMTTEIMEAFKALRDSEYSESRELLTNPGLRREAYRKLALSTEQTALGTEAWYQIDTTDYPNAVSYDGDRVTVYQTTDNIYGTEGDTSGNICWIIAEESSSTSLTDWVNNLDVGDEDLMSIATYEIRDESCGCEKYTWWWCSKYNLCETYKSYDDGYDGFVKNFNSMRLDIWENVGTYCSTDDRLVLAGYSRGGGIMNAMAYIVYKDDLWNLTNTVLVTFGSPRTLGDDLSDEVHLQFEQLRLVYELDPIPSVPYGWMGYKHFGTMKCNNCGYTESRDAPSWSWFVDGGIEDHLSYGDWF